MKGKFYFGLLALCALLSAVLVAPALGRGPEDIDKKYKEMRMQMIKQLKLAPDKEKAVLAVGDEYGGQRKDITDGMKKDRDELQAALAAPKPDETKIKELVNALNSGQDKLFASFKSQRDAELALMTPVEQGKYLMEMLRWRQQIMRKGVKK